MLLNCYLMRNIFVKKEEKVNNPNSFTVKKLSESQILSVYTEIAVRHFPEDELKPAPMIERLLSEGCYEGMGLFTGDKLAGYALFVHAPGNRILLLDYYAILEEYRESGMGSLFLQKMREGFPGCAAILIETEEEEAATGEAERIQRVRRNAFYLKNGCRRTLVRSRLFGVDFGIFVLPVEDVLTDEEAYARLEEIYRYVFAGDDFAKYVRMGMDA